MRGERRGRKRCIYITLFALGGRNLPAGRRHRSCRANRISLGYILNSHNPASGSLLTRKDPDSSELIQLELEAKPVACTDLIRPGIQRVLIWELSWGQLCNLLILKQLLVAQGVLLLFGALQPAIDYS